MEIKVSASLDCANYMALLEDVRKLERGGVNMLHIDIMDGVFVPNFALGTNLIRKLRSETQLPFDVHLMVQNPEPHIPLFAQLGADIITFHVEASTRLHQMVQLAQKMGKKVGVALSPSTPPHVLSYLLPYLDMVLLMTVDPGFVGQSFIPEVIPKVGIVRKMVQDMNKLIDIQVDGGISEGTVPLLKKAGANVFVAGTSSIFSGKGDLEELARKFCKFCRECP